MIPFIGPFKKKCRRCGKILFLVDFYPAHQNRDRHASLCKNCVKEDVKEWRRNNPERVKARFYQERSIPDIKVCFMCGEEKPASEFSKDGNYTDGLNPYCKNCHIEMIKRVAQERREAAAEPPPTKTCARCKVEKPASEFGRNWRNSDTLHSYCKECRKGK